MEPPAQAWRHVLAPYTVHRPGRAAWELGWTVVAFCAVFGVLTHGLSRGVWPILLLVPLASLLQLRLFTLQHDCGHRSLFRGAAVNDWVGRALALLMLTPYAAWRRNHATHHATSGDLSRRGVGDVPLLTVAEYRAMGAFQRWRYRAYRHPLVLFGIGPTVQFWVLYRWQTGNPAPRRADRLSVLGTDLAIVVAACGIEATIGLQRFMLAYAPVAVLTASIGVWLFFLQHHFEHAYWRPAATWKFEAAALQGSSLYELPAVLHWLTNNICFHHIHHLSSRIPGHRLRACFAAIPALHAAQRIRLRNGWRLARLNLWDEEVQRMVAIRDLRPRGE